MEGIFKGWIEGKSYGFVQVGGGARDVFVHQSTIANPGVLKRGTTVTFDVEESERGRAAVNVGLVGTATTQATTLSPISEERHCGRVKLWNEKGWGFIDADDRLPDMFVHASTFPAGHPGYLTPGDLVEYQVAETDRGFQAVNVEVTGWTAPDNPLLAFADVGGPGWLEPLKGLAEDEPWDYKHSPCSEPLPVLRSYLRYTFQRLQEMDQGISVAEDSSAAAFNTGLVTPNQEDIYAYFVPNRQADRQPWQLAGFRKASDWRLIENFGSCLPPLADYFQDPSVLLYDRRCELYINIDHVMEHIERFPTGLQENEFIARQLLTSAEAVTKKRVYRNYKTAIPQFYRADGGSGTVQLLMPICLETPARADLALVVERVEGGRAYRGSTVLTLDMAYNNARLLARPDTEWLQP